jgi:hypothetical protein
LGKNKIIAIVLQLIKDSISVDTVHELGGLWHEINDKELSDFKGSVVNREEWGIG